MSKYFNVNYADQDLTFIIQKSGYGKHVRDLEKRIEKAIEHIEHELNEHILLNDEVTWNEEFYTNGKLDYRKLLIALLQQTLDILKGSDKE